MTLVHTIFLQLLTFLRIFQPLVFLLGNVNQYFGLFSFSSFFEKKIYKTKQAMPYPITRHHFVFLNELYHYHISILIHLLFAFQLLATLSAAWTCVGHGLLTGYTAQALPSMMRADSTIQMTETHKTWISNYFLI